MLEVDGELGERVAIIIIGGAAVGLGYGSKHATKDIDLWASRDLDPFWHAVERVKRRTGMKIPIAETPVAVAPACFEDRLQQYPLSGAKHLDVFLPERHDLVMMKTARGETPDIQAIIDIHQREPLDSQILIQRYLAMIGIVMGPPSRFRLNFLGMIEAVFGEQVATEVDAKVPRVKST